MMRLCNQRTTWAKSYEDPHSSGPAPAPLSYRIKKAKPLRERDIPYPTQPDQIASTSFNFNVSLTTSSRWPSSTGLRILPTTWLWCGFVPTALFRELIEHPKSKERRHKTPTFDGPPVSFCNVYWQPNQQFLSFPVLDISGGLSIIHTHVSRSCPDGELSDGSDPMFSFASVVLSRRQLPLPQHGIRRLLLC